MNDDSTVAVELLHGASPTEPGWLVTSMRGNMLAELANHQFLARVIDPQTGDVLDYPEVPDRSFKLAITDEYLLVSFQLSPMNFVAYRWDE